MEENSIPISTGKHPYTILQGGAIVKVYLHDSDKKIGVEYDSKAFEESLSNENQQSVLDSFEKARQQNPNLFNGNILYAEVARDGSVSARPCEYATHAAYRKGELSKDINVIASNSLCMLLTADGFFVVGTRNESFLREPYTNKLLEAPGGYNGSNKEQTADLERLEKDKGCYTKFLDSEGLKKFREEVFDISEDDIVSITPMGYTTVQFKNPDKELFLVHFSVVKTTLTYQEVMDRTKAKHSTVHKKPPELLPVKPEAFTRAVVNNEDRKVSIASSHQAYRFTDSQDPFLDIMYYFTNNVIVNQTIEQEKLLRGLMKVDLEKVVVPRKSYDQLFRSFS